MKAKTLEVMTHIRQILFVMACLLNGQCPVQESNGGSHK